MNLFGGDWNEWKLALMAPRSLSGRVVALALVLVVLVLAFRALRGEQPRRRWLLLGLRTVGILATLLLFFQPTIRLRAVSRMPNHIAVTSGGHERRERVGQGEHLTTHCVVGRAGLRGCGVEPESIRFLVGQVAVRAGHAGDASCVMGHLTGVMAVRLAEM